MRNVPDSTQHNRHHSVKESSGYRKSNCTGCHRQQPFIGCRTCYERSVVVLWFAICSSDLTNTRHVCYLAVSRFSSYSQCQASVLLTSMVRILFYCRHKPTRCVPLSDASVTATVQMTLPIYLNYSWTLTINCFLVFNTMLRMFLSHFYLQTLNILII